jgi:hypothetical protein
MTCAYVDEWLTRSVREPASSDLLLPRAKVGG